MIYIISGYMRSYTTMMMHCLEAGGMEVVWDSERDDWASQNGIEVNPDNKLREITDSTLATFWENPAQFDGKVIKILSKYGYLRLPPWEYKVIVMTRNPEEIRQSFHRVFGKPLEYSDPSGESKPLSDDLYEHILRGTLSDLANAGIDALLLSGNTVLKKPLQVFEFLKQNGWPIEPQRAAAEVQPQYQHIAV